MNIVEKFNSLYEKFREPGFESRYLPPNRLESYLENRFPNRKLIGKSFLGKDINLLKAGTGKTKILAWSQMHGNESTGTRAMLDIFNLAESDSELIKNIFSEITLYWIPMLNPDGAALYTRRNAVGIDLNRDFLKESSPEIAVLKAQIAEIQPDYLFNIHDQRTIYNVGELKKPTVMAFLAPSFNESREINPVRVKSMSVISHIYKGLSWEVPSRIARYSDEFYPTSTGDNFMNAGLPAVLFEGGHYPDDYSRNRVRRYYALALLLGMESIALGKEPEIGDYFKIPENNKKFLDVILRNVRVQGPQGDSILDIGILFEEKLDDEIGDIRFISKIEEIGDLSAFFGHVDVDMDGEVYESENNPYPKLTETADFSVGAFRFVKGLFSS